MYEDFYQLTADPFRLSPDHSFCFRYPSFIKAKAYMRYALNTAEGFVMVTGRPGMGKTTLISDLLSDLADADDYLTGMLVNTQLEAAALLRMLAYEFGLNAQNQDKATVLHKLHQFFVQVSRSKRRPLLVVDEAQNLQLESLEELRLLTNLQFEGRPLLQIFMVGQEQLRDKLQDVRLEQLRQRITAACHLDPLTLEQTTAYIIHRLRVVGWNTAPEITAPTLQVIQEVSEGVPRRINQFCSRLLLHGALEQKYRLTPQDAVLVVEELNEEHLAPVPSKHDFLSGAARPASAQAGSEPYVADESLLRAAEELLRQQECTNNKPRPVVSKTVSPSDQDKRQRAESDPVIPTLAEPQIIEPTAPDSDERIQGTVDPADETPARQSRWPVFAYTLIIVLVMAIPILAMSNRYLEEWLPGRLRAMLTSPSRAESDPNAPSLGGGARQEKSPIGQQYLEQAQGASAAGNPGAQPQPPPAITQRGTSDSAPGPSHEYGDRADSYLKAKSRPATAAKPKPGSVRLTDRGRQAARDARENPVSDDSPPLSDRSEAALVREISFGFDSAEIGPQDRSLLDELAASMKSSDRWTAHIVGYTDSVGSRNYNQRLSQRRANVVAAYLTRQGISSNRLRIEGRGSFEPLSQEIGETSPPPAERLVRILLKPR